MSPHLLARVGVERFAFPLAVVLEAIDAPPMHPTPGHAPGVLGTMRHRARTVPVRDAAQVFGVPRDLTTSTALVLGLSTPLALLVDDAEDIVSLDLNTMRPPPPGTDAAGLLAGVQLLDGHLVNVVRVEALAARVERSSESVERSPA